MRTKFTTAVKSRKNKYDRKAYLEKKHQLGVKLTWLEIVEYVRLSLLSFKNKYF